MTDARPGWFVWRAIGPGLVFLLTVVGPGDLVANVAAGASHGYGLLWVLPIALIFRFVWLSASARYVLVTGETMIDGFSRYGRGVLWLVLGALALIRHMSNLTKVLLIGGAAEVLLPLPIPHGAAVWALAITLGAWGMMIRGGYAPIERLCTLVAMVLGAALVAAVMAVRPPVADVAIGLFVPRAPQDVGLYSTALLVLALVGTESGSLTNITYSYFVVEKGWKDVGDLRAQRIDLAVGIGALLVAGVLLQVLAAATLSGTGARVESVDDLSRILSTQFGRVGLIVFSAGLLGKTFAGLVGGTAGYALVASDIWRRLRIGQITRTGGPRRRDRAYAAAVSILVLSPLYVIFTGWKPVLLALVASAAMAVLIPLLAIGLLVLGNDRARLGAHANGWLANSLIVALAVIAMVLIVANATAFLGHLVR